MSEAKGSYQVILEKVPEERQAETALFLSGCFSLPPASTRGIAASGPIAILSDITQEQAEAILAELTPSLPAGVTLRLSDGQETTRASRLQWPRPPRIYGRDLDEFNSEDRSHELKCPICGGLLRITQEPDGLKALPAGMEKRKRGETLFRPAAGSDQDPLFSGLKPLASASGNFASLRSLQAGDTGFWLDHGHGQPEPHEMARGEAEGRKNAGETTNAKRSSAAKGSVGLAAFMKPGAYALVVSRTRDPQAVKMISEIMGMSEADARDKCMNLGLCVVRDVALDEAQNLLARFRNLGARARIVKPM